MSPLEALRSGDVQAALSSLKEEVRRAPQDGRLRVFLFQLFCITGEWERALTQLSLAGELDSQAQTLVQTYQILIRCEMLRESVFRGERSPIVFGDPGPWLPLLIEAARLLGSGQAAKAAELRDRAFEMAPEGSASLNGIAADWVADADPRLGPAIEAIVDGRYFWIPYTAVSSIAVEPPVDLRDQVWMPAQFTWANQGTSIGFIPTRYPGTTAAADPALLLARRTEWLEQEQWSIPVGQRMLITDGGETALMDMRALLFHSAQPSA